MRRAMCQSCGYGCAQRWTGGLLLVVAFTACLSGCHAPTGASSGIKQLALTDINGHADFVLRHQERDQESKTTTSETRSEETTYEESLSLRTEGYVYHPNILEFVLGGAYGLVQEQFEEVVDGEDRRATNDGDLLEFDAEAKFLKKRPYPLSVFAHRSRNLVPRPFLSSLEATTTDYGFNWQYVSEKMPTSLQYTYTDVELSPLLTAGTGDEEGREKDSELRFETAYNFTEYNSLSLLYEHNTVEEKPFDLEYDSDEVTMTHRLRFGEKQRHDLRSELNFLDQRGSIEEDRVRWREDLRLRHTDTLESLFELEAFDRTRGNRSSAAPDVEERSGSLSASLRHQLYQSLTSRVRVFGRQQDFDPDLEITRWGGQVSFGYRKTNPWGVLHADYGFRAETNDNRGEAQIVEVVEEPQTFHDPDPVTLTNQNIQVGTIFVRGKDRKTVYQRGRDFVVRTFGEITQLERVPTGRITDGETVLVDYLYTQGGNFELDTVSQDFSIRQDFEFGLTPYYRFEWQDQTLSPPDATGTIAEDITGHIAGLEFRRAALRLFGEYEDHDSTVTPFIAKRCGASYTHRFRSGAEASVHTRWTDTNHGPPTERDITLLTAEGRFRQVIKQNFTVEGAVLYRNGEDSISRDTEGVDASLALEWSVRQTEFRVSLEYSEFDDQFTRNDSTALFVHVRRDLWPR